MCLLSLVLECDICCGGEKCLLFGVTRLSLIHVGYQTRKISFCLWFSDVRTNTITYVSLKWIIHLKITTPTIQHRLVKPLCNNQRAWDYSIGLIEFYLQHSSSCQGALSSSHSTGFTIVAVCTVFSVVLTT